MWETPVMGGRWGGSPAKQESVMRNRRIMEWKPQTRDGRSKAKPQSNGAKSLQCVPACRRFWLHNARKSGSKLRAVQTLRDSSHAPTILAACENVSIVHFI